MNVYKISELAYGQYDGLGHALVAVSDDEVIKIVYIRDIIDDEYYSSGDDELGIFTDADLLRFLKHPEVEKTAKDLARYGSVHFGMLSCYEFIEL